MVKGTNNARLGPSGAELILKAAEWGVLSSTSDRDWRTFTAVLLLLDGWGHGRVSYQSLAAVLGCSAEEAAERLQASVAIRVRGEPILWLLMEPSEKSDSAGGPAEVSVWLNYWLFLDQDGFDALQPVFRYAANCFGRPLASLEIQALVRWGQDYGLDPLVISELLYRFVELRGKKHWKYLDAVARGWHDEGIRSMEDLRAHLDQDHTFRARYNRILKALNPGRLLMSAEREMIKKWSGDWGFSDEVILRSCEAAAGSQNPLKRVDRILDQWNKAGVRTVADADRERDKIKQRWESLQSRRGEKKPRDEGLRDLTNPKKYDDIMDW